MKGTILKCLQDLVSEKFGKDQWKKSLENVGIDKNKIFLTTSDIDDAEAISVFNSVCKTLNLTFQEAADVFGEYWVSEYSQKLYKVYYRNHKTSKDLLLSMDQVHIMTTQMIADSKPPRFDYEWEDDNNLIIHYKSHRNLIDLFIGLIKGVGTFYGDNISVKKIDSSKVKVFFPYI